MEPIGVLVVVFLLAVPFALWAMHKHRQQVESWRAYAALNGLTFQEKGEGSGPSMLGTREHDGRTDEVKLWLESRGSGDDAVTYTCVAAGHHLHLPEGLLVTPAGAGTSIAKFFGAQDIELGNPAVDPGLRIRGAPEPAVRQALASPRLQQAILGFVTGLDEASMTATGLRLAERGWKLEARELDVLLDQVQDAVTELLEPVRFDPSQVRAHVAQPRRARRPVTVAPTPRPAATAAAVPDAPVDRLIADLTTGGIRMTPGAFTLDRRAAREKMREFQLAEPGAWALELVQALIARGAAAVHLEADRDDLVLRADGRPLTADDLDDVWGAMLAAGEDDDLRARQRLAIGLNTLCGLGPKRLEIWSGDDGRGIRAILVPEAEGRPEPAPGPPGLTGTAVTLELGLVDAARNPNAAVKRLVRERAVHAAVPVTIDGEVVSDGFRPRTLHGLVGLDHDGFRAVGGINLTLGTDTRLRLQTDGVWIQEEPIEAGTPGLVVVIESARFRKDVSQSCIVKDAIRAQADDLVTVVEETVLATLAASLGAGAGSPGGGVEAIRATLRRRLLTFADPAAFRPGGEAQALADAPLYPSRGGGGHVSLTTLLALRDSGQPVPFADLLTTHLARPVVGAGVCLDLDRLPDPADRSLLVHLLGSALVHLD